MRRWPNSAGSAPPPSTSACPIPACRCRPTTSSPRPKPAPTCRVSTASATATAPPTTPTSPTTAFALGAKSGDPVQMYLSDIYTISTNLAGLPGMSIPCGFGADGMPVGLQLVGTYFSEARMLGAAHRYQQATDWHRRQPAGL